MGNIMHQRIIACIPQHLFRHGDIRGVEDFFLPGFQSDLHRTRGGFLVGLDLRHGDLAALHII